MRRTFGIQTLRTGQEGVITRVLEGKDTLVVMPTGAGKSLCYQLPALHLDGTTVVVSPLIALMKDQADKLGEAGVATVQLNSTLTGSHEADALAKVAKGEVPIVFATPERMTDPATLAALRRTRVKLFVVDEAHCISQWGHDFRPAYLEMSAALAALGQPPVLALTATATDNVIADIASQLRRPAMAVVQTGVYRENLHYRILNTTNEDERVARVVQIVRDSTGSGIVYAATIKLAEVLYEALRQAGVPAGRYHGALGPRERHEQQDAFMSGERVVMVATNAFGLGVDKADIRYVVHAQMPGSIEAYYQETGRGGRDGEPARCTLLYDVRDRRVQQFFLTRRYPNAGQVQLVRQQIVLLATNEPVPFNVLRESLPTIAASKIKVAVKLLADAGLVVRRASGALKMGKAPVDAEQVAQLVLGYTGRAAQDREKLERMVFYAQTGLCRWRVLLEYFGESLESGGHCGNCDACIRAVQHTKAAAVTPNPLRVAAIKRRREYERGDEVQVPRHGAGRVLRAENDQVTVEFPNGDARTFLRSYVQKLLPPQTAQFGGPPPSSA
ncbi:MAG: ATP-dependent DNA helicase RecQ [Betaproteobacteria bacterium]